MSEKFFPPQNIGLGHAVERAPEDPVGLFLEQSFIKRETPTGDFSFLSPAQRAEMLWEVFQEVKSKYANLFITMRKDAMQEESFKAQEEFDQNIALLITLYNDPQTKEIYLREIHRHAEEEKLLNGSYEKYRQLRGEINDLELAYDDVSNRMFAKRGVRIGALDKITYQRIIRTLETKRQDKKRMLAESPRLAARVSCEQMQEYSSQLDHEKFMWLPSRRAILEEIEKAALSARPVLLLGESGTGKTSLVKAASRKLTGQAPFKAQGGPSTRLQDSIAKKGMAADGTSLLDYQALAKAMTGMDASTDSVAKHEGGVYFDDEFNNRGKEEQLELIKAVSGVVPGTEEVMPIIGKVFIQPRYMFVAAGNPPSERYDRIPMDPAVRREFGAAVTVDYPEQTTENPELFEAMIAALMDKNGRLRFSSDEISPAWKEKIEGKKKMRELDTDPKKGGALWRFASAMAELYKSISYKQTVLHDRGVAQFFSEFVLDPGVVFGWLRQAVEQGYTDSLEAYLMDLLDKKLAEPGISKADVTLVKDFFAFFGLSSGATAQQSVRQFSVLTPEQIGLLSPRVRFFETVVADVQDATAIISGKTVRYKTEGTAEAPIGSVRVKGKGAKAKRWEVLGHTDDGHLVIHSPDVRGAHTTKVIPADFLTWEPGIDAVTEIGKILMEKLPSSVRDILEGRDSRQGFEAVVRREQDAIKKFFGYDIPVPPPPSEITPERYAGWQEKGLEIHYLPPVQMADIQKTGSTITAVTAKDIRAWIKKPGIQYTSNGNGIDFFDAIRQGHLSEDAAKLPGSWVLVDTRQKPEYDDGKQAYKTDVLAPVVEALRKQGLIEDFTVKTSRFHMSPRELEKPEVKAVVAAALGIPVVALHLPRAIEQSYLATVFYPTWGDTRTSEWFEDTYQGQRRLYGGDSAFGGLSYVRWGALGSRDDRIGWRPLGRFS